MMEEKHAIRVLFFHHEKAPPIRHGSRRRRRPRKSAEMRGNAQINAFDVS
jgi:hypothetical protein